METTSAQWHKSINTLPLCEFIKVVVDDNLSALIISGLPSEEELQKAWRVIHSQYQDAIGSEESTHYLNVFKSVTLLTTNFKMVNLLIMALQSWNSNSLFAGELYDELNKLLHSNFRFSPTDFALNEKYLKSCKSKAKSIKIQLDLQQIQLNALEEKRSSENEKPTLKYYQSLLISLSDHAGFYLNEDITTYEFCDRMRRLNKHIANKNRGL